MIFHENRLLADDSHETSYLLFFRKLGNMSQNLSSAAVVIGALRVNIHSESDSLEQHKKKCPHFLSKPYSFPVLNQNFLTQAGC